MPRQERGKNAQTVAENWGQGNQYISHGAGDQNAVYDQGTLFNYKQQLNINYIGRKNGKMGIPPSVGQFFQKIGGPESWRQEPSDRNIFEWLTTQPNQVPLNFSQHQRNLLEQLSPGTGKWILNTEEFLQWSGDSKSSRILWMHGILGSGKTMLLSLIIDSIEDRIRGSNEAVCIYFFFQAEKNAVPFTRIWATLLTQLLRANPSNIAAALKKKFSDPFKRTTALDSSEYFDLFKAQVATIKTVYLVIDALDSCQQAPREATLKGIQKALVNLPQNVRILFTSRDKYIGKDFGAHRELSITPREADIKAYIQNRITEDRHLHSVLFKTEYQREIIQGVTARAMSSKMFLSAKLYMDYLNKQGTNFIGITRALNHLPDSALGAFKVTTKQIAQKMKANGRSGELLLTKHILLWVSHAKVDINIEQIQDSFAAQKSEGQSSVYQHHRPPEELVMRACTDLVTTENGTLGLVHKSVKKHLLQYEIVSNNADLEMGKTCLYFLITTTKEKGNSPLLKYAAKHWWAHLNSRDQVFDEKTDTLVMKFLRDGTNLTKAFKAMEDVGDCAFDGMTGWHAAAYFDLLSWAERFPSNIDINARCSDGQTALHWAIRHGRHEFVELLIRKSASPNLCDHAGDTPLHKALAGSAADNVAMAKALINGNARLNMRNSKGVSPIETVIQYGPTSIAKLMIESQQDVSAEIFEDWTLLRYVLSHGQEIFGVVNQESLQTKQGEWSQLQIAVKDHAHSLTELLLERGVDLNRPSTKDGWTPLVFAASKGDLFLMRWLLTREPHPARVDMQDREGKTPLWWAIHCGVASAIQLLSDHDANVNETYRDGSTPLYEAIKNKNSELVRLLVSLGANVNTRTANGSTMLIEAIRLRDRETIWVLLNAKAKPDEQDASGKSALLYTIENQDNDIAWLLICRSVTVIRPSLAKHSRGENTDMYLKSPLELALRLNNHHVAWLLCDHGVSPNTSVDETGKTLLHLAVCSGSLRAVHLLIDYGAKADAQGEGGLTPLHYAVLLDREDIVTLLASHAAEIPQLDITDAKGNTALVLSILKKNTTITRILLRHRASCSIVDSRGLTAVHHAARLGFNEGLCMLLDNGGDPNAVDKKNFSPVHHAINGRYSDSGLVRTLLAAGANIGMADGNGRTPLMLAAQLGKDELVECLLDEGADPHACDGGGYTVVHYSKHYSGIQDLLIARGACRM